MEEVDTDSIEERFVSVEGAGVRCTFWSLAQDSRSSFSTA